MHADMDGRRFDLDWLRIAAFGLLILYHVGMFYVPWGWHIKTDRPIEWLQPVMAAVNPWRLILLFFVSGAATRFMLGKWTPWRLLRERTPRLLVPLVFGMLVIVPPQTFIQLAWSGAAPAVRDFYPAYVAGSGGWTADGAPLVTPTWNHLWFVAYLLAYTVGTGVLLACVPWLASATERLADAAGARGWPLAVPALWFVWVQLAVAPSHPETHAFVGDWSVHAQSLAAFSLGFAMARAAPAWASLVAHRGAWAAAAGLCLATYVSTLSLRIAGAIDADAARPVLQVAFGASQWLCTCALLALAARHLRGRDHRARRYLTEAIFPFYIVHQTAIIVAAWLLRPLQLAAPIEAAVLIAATIAACVAAFELVRRVRLLRPLFGLAPSRPFTPPGARR